MIENSRKTDIKFRTENTCLGYITVYCNENSVIKVCFGDFRGEDETNLLKETFLQINEYLIGKRKKFEIPISFSGTAFQNKIWNELLKIPYGETVTYGEIAKRAGNKNACRAAGSACSKNPIAIIVPCHRVIGSNGSLTGFAGGIYNKSQLISIEKRFVRKIN